MTTGCPHGANSNPDRCSQCIGARARVVRSDEHGVAIDGELARGPWRASDHPGSVGERNRGRPRKAAARPAPAPMVELELAPVATIEPPPPRSAPPPAPPAPPALEPASQPPPPPDPSAERGRRRFSVMASVHEDEQNAIWEAAAAAGLSVSTWLRLAALACTKYGPLYQLLAAAVRYDRAFSTDDDPDQEHAEEALTTALFAWTKSLTEHERAALLPDGFELHPRYSIGVGGVRIEHDAEPAP